MMKIQNITKTTMPLVSIIIPIYKVGPYVRKCLQSVADQTYPNIETLIVNDATPDDSMIVVNRSLEAVPNVRIINLPENLGLGNARNTGIKHAMGKYIFFLDSDDWLDPTAIEKAVTKGDTCNSEVVVVDYYRANHGSLTKAKDRTPYRGARYDYFDPRDEKSVLWLFNLAQIRLYQKNFLIDNAFSFRDGVIYEDVDWTFKIMTTARRVSIVDEPLYYYRSARPGSILSTVGENHFDILDQYRRVFEYLEVSGKEEFLETIYPYALNAIYFILVVSQRIPQRRRTAFFNEAQKIFQDARGDRTFKVTLYNRGQFDVILRHGNYTLLRMWRSKFYQKTVSAAKRQIKRARKQLKIIAQTAYIRYPDLGDKYLRRIPRADIVFESYWGTQYSDSPKYIYQYIKKHHPNIRCVFALRNDVDCDIPKNDRVRWNSYDYNVALIGAKVWVNNNNFTAETKKRDGQKFIQTFHGIPLKKIGTDAIGYPDTQQRVNWAALVARCAMWDDVVTSGAYHSETLRAAFQTNAVFHEVGSPRTDCLQDATLRQQWNTDVRRHFGLNETCKIVLYAPTWRKKSEKVYLSKSQLNRLCASAGDDVVVLYRNHHWGDARVPVDRRILNATNYSDSQHLCAAADLLITDYSSIAMDYAATGRPAVLYIPDYKKYSEVRGLYLDMPTKLSDVTCADYETLLSVCVDALRDDVKAMKLNHVLKDNFLDAERPDSCRYVTQELILPHLMAVNT